MNKNKLLMKAEIAIVLLYIFIIILGCLLALIGNVDYEWERACIILFTVIFPLGIIFPISLHLESQARIFICKKCEHKHKLSEKEILWSPHYGWTRYVRCPKCNKKSWNKSQIDE